MARLCTEESAVVEELDVSCPYCGETISVLVDNSVDEQEYYEDCSVCCCPILFVISVDEINNITLFVKSEND